jgi:pimeloyl-ACP methyl ester carboxylesterase
VIASEPVFTLVDSHVTAYREEGQGPPLLLLHGLGSSGDSFAALSHRLSASVRVIAPDLLGSGRTAKPDIDYRPQETARHVVKLCTSLSLGPLRGVLGHSQGAAVAIELCHLVPVERLILVDPPPPRGVRWLRALSLLGSTRGATDLVSALLPHRRLARAWLSFLYADPKRVTPATLEAYAEMSQRRGYAPATMNALRSLGGLSLNLNGLPRALLVWGAEDPLFPPSGARLWRKYLPESELVVLPATGHCPHEEAPDAVATAVRSFLRESLDGLQRSA